MLSRGIHDLFLALFLILLLPSITLAPPLTSATQISSLPLQQNKEGRDSHLFNEKNLLELARQSSPQIKALKARSTQAEFATSSLSTRYEARSHLSYNYASSNENGLAPFIPVFSPTRDLALGVSKKTPYGVTVLAEGFGESIHTRDGTINNAARSGTRLRVEIDLLKNLFGRVDASELRSSRLQSERARTQALLDQNEFELELRKLYWALIANDKSLTLSEQLVTSAQRQLNDSIRRSQAGAADQGDVARNQALLQSRQSSVYLFQYEKTQLEAQLRQWVPALTQTQIQLQPEGQSLTHTVRAVLACVDQIVSSPQPNEAESDYFKIIHLAENQHQQEQRLAQATGSWDLKLSSYYQQSGTGEGFGESRKDYSNHARDAYGVGVTLSIPIEGTSRQARKTHRLFVDQQFESDIATTRLRITENHRQVVKALQLLRDAAKAQQLNVTALETSLQSIQRKYRQARVDLSQLIFEQDTLFNSQLQEIQTKLMVIHALYDYFKIFNQHSCPLNKI